MTSVPVDTTTELRVDARRARFREAVSALSTRARSGDLLRMLLLPASTLVVVGFGLMLLGWWGAAHTHRQVEQIPYLISGGLIGLGLVLLGGLLLATAVWMACLQRMRQQSDERSRAQLAELIAAMPQPVPPTRTRSARAKASD
jgi:cytochrome c biogenesis protein CcdA